MLFLDFFPRLIYLSFFCNLLIPVSNPLPSVWIPIWPDFHSIFSEHLNVQPFYSTILPFLNFCNLTNFSFNIFSWASNSYFPSSDLAFSRFKSYFFLTKFFCVLFKPFSTSSDSLYNPSILFRLLFNSSFFSSNSFCFSIKIVRYQILV